MAGETLNPNEIEQLLAEAGIESRPAAAVPVHAVPAQKPAAEPPRRSRCCKQRPAP